MASPSESSESDTCFDSDSSQLESDEEIKEGRVAGPIAYAFEPRVLRENYTQPKPRMAAPADPDPRAHRLENTDWCKCGKCIIMATSEECICCQEIMNAACKIPPGKLCITDNPSFSHVCIDIEVLEVALLLMAFVRVDSLKRPINSM